MIQEKLGWFRKDPEDRPPAVVATEEEESRLLRVRRRNRTRLILIVMLFDSEDCPRCGQEIAVLAAGPSWE